MKLNADIIYKELCSRYRNVGKRGPESFSLHLKRPQFYVEGDTVFKENRIYITTAERLPQRPTIERGCVLICIGDSTRLSYYQERCTVIHIKDRRDFFGVYQVVQDIFDRYDNWNDHLFGLFRSDADLQKLLEATLEIFDNPMIILDSNFHFLAKALPVGGEVNDPWDFDGITLDEGSMKEYLQSGTLSIDVHEPIFMNFGSHQCLAVNLFDSRNTYIGCFTIYSSKSDFLKGEGAVASYIARMFEQSLERNPLILSSERSTMKQILRQLIEEMPISPNQRVLLNAHHRKSRYVCVSMHVLADYSQMPLTYISNIFELTFPDSIAFPIGSQVLGFVNIDSLSGKCNDYTGQLSGKLIPVLESLKLVCGISNDFTDLYDAKIYFRQAEAAYENGIIVNPMTTFHYFSSYVLMEMITNSLGGLPVETYYPNGLRELLKHDEESGVSYIETLKVFLEENMSYTSASRILYVHRSTLIDRINRIQRDLGVDLNDSNERLHLRMLIKAMEIESILRNDHKE